jgi:hypothetical protein
MEFVRYRILAESRIFHVQRSALTNGLHGYRALAGLRPPAAELSSHQAIGFRAHQFLSRSTAPEVGAIHLEKSARLLAEEADQSRGRSAPCGRL